MVLTIQILDYSLINVKGFSLSLEKTGGVCLIYERILSLCSEKEMSISQLEREAGLGNGTIKVWAKSDPGAKKLKKVADLLGCSVDYLLEHDPQRSADASAS